MDLFEKVCVTIIFYVLTRICFRYKNAKQLLVDPVLEAELKKYTSLDDFCVVSFQFKFRIKNSLVMQPLSRLVKSKVATVPVYLLFTFR